MLGLFALVAYRVGLLTTALIGSIGLIFRQPWGRYLGAVGLVYFVMQQGLELWEMIEEEHILAVAYPWMYAAYYGSVNLMVISTLGLVFHPALLTGHSGAWRLLGRVLPAYFVVGVLSGWAVFLLSYRLDNTGWQVMIAAVDVGQVKAVFYAFSIALALCCYLLLKRRAVASRAVLGAYSFIALLYLTYHLWNYSNVLSGMFIPDHYYAGFFAGRFFPVLALHVFIGLVPHSKDLYRVDEPSSARPDVLDTPL